MMRMPFPRTRRRTGKRQRCVVGTLQRPPVRTRQARQRLVSPSAQGTGAARPARSARPRPRPSPRPGSPSSRAQTTRKRPVPSSGLPRIGRPRIESQPSRSTSNGFSSTATAGHSQLCCGGRSPSRSLRGSWPRRLIATRASRAPSRSARSSAAGPRGRRPRAPSRAARCARVMSGWRTCGSSIGSASKTISERDSVSSMTSLAISSRLISFGLPMLTGSCTSGLGQQHEAADQVVDVAEAARLASRRRTPSPACRSAPGAGRSGSRGRRCGRMRGPFVLKMRAMQVSTPCWRR